MRMFFQLSSVCVYTCSAISGFFSVDTASAQEPATKVQPAAGTIKVNLAQAMDMSEEHSFQSRIASQTVEEQSARTRQAYMGLGPRLDLDSSQIWFSSDVNKLVGRPGQVTAPERINTASLTLSQPIVTLGPLLMRARVESSSLRVAEADKTQSKFNARYSGAEAFLGAVKAEQFLAVAKASLTVVEKQRRDGQALFNAGKLSQVDVVRLDLALSDAQTQLAQAQTTRDMAFFALGENLGIADYRVIELEAPPVSVYEQRTPKMPARDDILASAVRDRAEIKAASARVETAEYMKIASDFDYLPTINAFAKYERDFARHDVVIPGGGGGIAPTVLPKEDIRDSLSYGFVIKWNLWDWGSRIARSSEYQATISKSRLARDSAESGIRMEANQAALNLQYAVSNVDTAKTSLKFAEEAYRQQSIRFQNGSATVTDIITAERDQTRARGGLANARGDLDLAWLRVYKVMGKDPDLNATGK